MKPEDHKNFYYLFVGYFEYKFEVNLSNKFYF